MAAGQPVVLPLAKEADLYSQRDGTPNIYWSDPKSWPVSAGVRLIRVRAFVADMQDYANTDGPQYVEVKLFAQESIDGKTWRFVRAPDSSNEPLDFFGGRRPLTGANYDSASAIVEPFFTNNVMPPNGDFMPLVRYGLQIQQGSGATNAGQVYVRLTCELEITTSEPFTVVESVDDETIAASQTSTAVNSNWVIDVSTAQQITVIADATIQTTQTDAYRVGLEFSRDGTSFFMPGGASGTWSEYIDDTGTTGVTADVAGLYARVVYASAGGIGTASQDVAAIVRGNQ